MNDLTEAPKISVTTGAIPGSRKIYVGGDLRVLGAPLGNVTASVTSPLRTVAYQQPARKSAEYVVQAGDTVFSIARKFGIHHSDIQRWNTQLVANQIQPGQVLRVEDGSLRLNDGVVPYDLNTPLFSDYAHKLRTVWMPAASASSRMRSSSTVLPTPRSPTSIALLAGRPIRARSRAMWTDSISAPRPASSGGGVPAPGAKGFRIGFMGG